MNIHLKERHLFEKLLSNSKVEILVGSHLYGITNQNSDKDTLFITGEFQDNQNSLIWSHHQFQYKEDGVDYLFTSLSQFVRNILTGDSTINFEALFSDEISKSSISFLQKYQKDFITYNLIKSYIGLAKRDIKFFRKEKSLKRLFHIIRGVDTAELLLDEREYSNDLSYLEGHQLLLLAKNGQISSDQARSILSDYEEKNESLRVKINKLLDQGGISKGMNSSKLMELDQEVIEWNKKNSTHGLFLLEEIYESLFNDIKY